MLYKLGITNNNETISIQTKAIAIDPKINTAITVVIPWSAAQSKQPAIWTVGHTQPHSIIKKINDVIA